MKKPPPEKSEYERQFDEAISLRDNGRVVEAARLLRSLAVHEEERGAAGLILGGIYMNQGNYVDAEATFGTLVEKYPGSEKSSLGYFHSLWSLGRREDALAEMTRYLETYESWEYRRLRRDLRAEGILPALPRA